MPTNTWIASSPGLASDGAHWSLGRAPVDGDDVVFDGTSVNNCSWDLDASLVTVHSITIAAGYTGTVTQGDVDTRIGAGGYSQCGTFLSGVDHRELGKPGDDRSRHGHHNDGQLSQISDSECGYNDPRRGHGESQADNH